MIDLPKKTFALIALFLSCGLFGLSPVRAEAPEKALEIEGRTLRGEEFYLSDFFGEKPVLLNFFAVWCAPCREELPILAKLEREFPSVAFVSVDVESDTIAETLGFIEKLADAPTVVVNVSGAEGLMEAWGGYGMPFTFLIDRAGNLVERLPGEHPEAFLREKLTTLKNPD